MNIDERLEKLERGAEMLLQAAAKNDAAIAELREVVEKHERWQQKVERTLVAGIDAALREWRNGEGA